MALTALSYMGSNGVPPLLAAVRNPSHPFRGRAVYMLGRSKNLGPYADAVIAELVAELKEPDVNQVAANALGSLKSAPDISVPALAHCLQATNDAPNFRAIAAISLIWFEEKAEPALPYLTNALADPDAEVRRQATNSIHQIHLSILRK
jgi:HEAT repeat protein